MKKIFYIPLLLIGSLTVLSFANPDKKIAKVISKIWKNQELQLSNIEVPKEIDIAITSVQEVISENETIGYVCYLTSFGCRIGGCAVATKGDIQSYETFDYIVVYDKNIEILKVEITNYPGQYGYEICRTGWLKQFIGSTFDFKLNDNIDGISGATVSASFLIEDINKLGESLTIILQNNE